MSLENQIIQRNNVVQRTFQNPLLSVPNDQGFSPSGSGVVPHKTAVKLGYNGIAFRKDKACPELHDIRCQIVRESWPESYLRRYEDGESGGVVSEFLKCAPENWILRRPSIRFKGVHGEIVARYPPRNFLNSLFKRGPRERADWIPEQTYEEPPVPLIAKTSAYDAMKAFGEKM